MVVTSLLFLSSVRIQHKAGRIKRKIFRTCSPSSRAILYTNEAATISFFFSAERTFESFVAYHNPLPMASTAAKTKQAQEKLCFSFSDAGVFSFLDIDIFLLCFKVTVQFERCFWLMDDISAIS